MSEDHTTNQQELHQQDQDNQGEQYDDQQQYEDNQGQEQDGVDVDEQIAEAQEDKDENGQDVDEEENQNGDGEYDADGQEHHHHDHDQQYGEEQNQQQDEGAYDYDANGEEQEERQEGYEDTYQYDSQKHHEDEREYQHGRQEEGEIPSDLAQQEHDALHEILQFPEGSTQYTYLQQQQQSTQAAQQVPYTFQENGIEYEAVEQTVIEYQPVERKITVMVPKKKTVSSVDLTNTLVHSQIRTFPTTGLYQPPPFLASSQIKLNPAVQPLQPYQTRVGNVLYQSQIVLQAPQVQQTNFQQPRSTTFIQPSVGQIGGSRIYTQPLNIPRPVNVTTGVTSTNNVTSTASVPAGLQTQIIRQQVPQQVQFQRQIVRSGQPILQLKQQPQQVQFKPITAQQQPQPQPQQQQQQPQQPQQIQQQFQQQQQQQQQFVQTNNAQVFRPPFPISNATSVQQPSFVKSPQVVQAPFLSQSRIVRQPFGATFTTTNPGFQSRPVFLPPTQTQRIVNSPWQFQTQNSNATTIKK